MQPQHLAQLRDLEALSAFLTRMGYQPAAAPWDGGARIVARWHRYRVIAFVASAPDEHVRTLARRLGTHGTLGLAVGLDPGVALALAAAESARHRPRVLRVPLDGSDRVAVSLLYDLAPRSGTTALTHALRVADVLGVETAGTQFFTAFRVMLQRMAGALDRRHTFDDRRMVALLALTRVLFLYFVQAKGWLDRNPTYLADLLDHALSRGRHFHRTYLHPLFFGTLNRPPARRSQRLHIGAIPYLNGGLFEPHGVERRVRGAHFSNALWRDAFDTVFQRFRFCVREADEVNAIHPDMLGHVFERLMAPDDRADSGTFYTPESVVRDLVRVTVDTAVTAGASVTALRVLDPAVGSGAFLLGALEHLTDLRLADRERAQPHRRLDARRNILRHNLFGVDVNPLAVRLAELRLWLALVADDPTHALEAIAPLPNLNGVVRQGDSLIDPLGFACRHVTVSQTRTMRDASARVANLRKALFEARGPGRATALARLAAAERRLAQPLLEAAIARLERGLAELHTQADNSDLFGKRIRLTAEQRALEREWTHSKRELERALKRLEDGGVPFFAFELHAPDVMAGGGFDVVVGNPPWVRAERLDPYMRAELRDRYSWWRTSGGAGYRHQPDLAVAFLQRSLELTKPGGVVGLLLPSKIATAGYAEVCRRSIVREHRIAYVHRVSDREARSFRATTYPMALVVERRPPQPHDAVTLGLADGDAIPQRDLDHPGSWMFVPRKAREALEAFLAGGRPLESVARVFLGVKTGADPLFVGTVLDADREVACVRLNGEPVAVERTVLRPAARGRDLRPFAVAPRRVVLWTHRRDGRPLERLPARAAAYFHRHESALSERSDYRRGPPWTLFRIDAAMAGHRLVWPDMCRRPAATVLEATAHPDAIPLNTCYVAQFRDRRTALAAAAILNSTWCAAYVAAAADEASSGYRRLNARIAARIPVPQGDALTALAALGANRHDAPLDHDDDLDDAVAAALDLSAAQRNALRRLATHTVGRASRRP